MHAGFLGRAPSRARWGSGWGWGCGTETDPLVFAPAPAGGPGEVGVGKRVPEHWAGSSFPDPELVVGVGLALLVW